jgi:hypothetical protein
MEAGWMHGEEGLKQEENDFRTKGYSGREDGIPVECSRV